MTIFEGGEGGGRGRAHDIEHNIDVLSGTLKLQVSF